MASITIQSDSENQKVALQEGAVTLGRGLESEIRLKDIKASRRHFQIAKSPQGYECIDLQSGNGTFVNGASVKRHRLSPGDRIQVGGTTIIFHDDPPPAPKPPAPVAAPTERPVTVRPTTSRIPVAPTQKMTARAGTDRATPTKAGTRPITRLSGSTRRGGGTTRATKVVSKTQQFHAEGRRKKTNPLVFVFGGIGVIFLGVVGYILFSGRGADPKLVNEKLNLVLRDAYKFDDENKFDQAEAKFKEAYQLTDGWESLKTKALEIKANLKDLEQRKKGMEEAEGRFRAFRSKFHARAKEGAAVLTDLNSLYQEGSRLREAYGAAQVSWMKDLTAILETLDREIKEIRDQDKARDFQVFLPALTEKHKLKDQKGEAQWGAALEEFRKYAEDKTVSQENRDKADRYVKDALKGLINDDLRRLRKRAERAAEERRKDEAVKELKQHLPRFERTDGQKDLQDLIRQIEG